MSDTEGVCNTAASPIAWVSVEVTVATIGTGRFTSANPAPLNESLLMTLEVMTTGSPVSVWSWMSVFVTVAVTATATGSVMA